MEYVSKWGGRYNTVRYTVSFAAEFEQNSGKQEMLNWQTEEGLPFPRVSIMLFDYVCTLN